MVWSEWDWLTLFIFILLLAVAVMSWPNNSNPNNRNAQQPTQRVQQTTTASDPSLARSTPAGVSRAASGASSHSPSMDISLPPTPPTVSFSTPADEQQYIATLLQHAHASMAQQKPMQALGLVLAAVRQQRGEEGVFDVLNETREGFGLKPHANPVRQQREALQQQQLQQMDAGMSSLSLQAAGPASPSQYSSTLQLPNGGSMHEDTDMADDSGGEDGEYEDDDEYVDEGEVSIVDEELVDEAVRAGTHVQCRACGGVIARSRMQAHTQLWCEANGSVQSHEDG